MNTILKSVLAKAGLVALKQDRYNSLLQNQRESWNDIAFLRQMPRQHLVQLFELLPESKSQLRQDLFVLSTLQFKSGGFFVEFGATNGVELNNSLLLEKHFGWRGILAEPARTWHASLKSNRPDCDLETDCVWSRTGETLDFMEAGWGVLSTIASFAEIDQHARGHKGNLHYSVTTISLNDMLAKYDAPREIDYLSIDTEGSEFEILSAFDFEKYRFSIITCEHNHTSKRSKIESLLVSQGYRRVFEDISDVDDWYVRV